MSGVLSAQTTHFVQPSTKTNLVNKSVLASVHVVTEASADKVETCITTDPLCFQDMASCLATPQAKGRIRNITQRVLLIKAK